MRIWYQSFADETIGGPYLRYLQSYLDSICQAGTEIVVHGMTPPDDYPHPMIELRCAYLAVQNVIQAARENYDAVLFGHMQDSGLWEARAAVDIPVLSLGEMSMLHCCTLGTRTCIVSLDQRYEPGFRHQIARYALTGRVPLVRSIAVDAGLTMQAFESEDHGRQFAEAFATQVRPFVAEGADVFIPGSGVPMLVLARQGMHEVDGAPVLNGVDLLVSAGEAAVARHRRTGVAASRVSDFRLPPQDVLTRFS